jgi:tetratricopeptide (TPR) repeat protein
MGEHVKAMSDYNMVIALNRNHALAYYKRGLAYRNKGEVFKAVSDLEKCIGLSTDPELTRDAQQVLNDIKGPREG